MSAAEMMGRVGKDGVWNVEGVRVLVRIMDARMVFNRLDFKIVPLMGAGEVWVSAARVGEPAKAEGGAK
jgi:hypothetical protein